MAQVIIGTVLEGYDFSGNPPLNSIGFEYSGSQYAFLHAGGSTTPNSDGKLHAFKSTDDGATWTEQDSAAAPFIGLNYSPGHTICRDGTNVYVIYIREAAGVVSGLSVVAYDISTDTWGTATDYFPTPHAAPNCPELGFIRTAATPAVTLLQICLVLRGAGDMVLYYPGPNAAGPLARVYYATFDGSTFGTGTILPDQVGDPAYFFPAGAVCEAAGITHFFYSITQRVGHPGFDYYHIAMDAGGSFGTRELVSDGGYLEHTLGTFAAPIVFTSGGNEYLAVAGLINDDLLATTQSEQLFYAQTVAGTGALTWSASVIAQDVYGGGSPNVLFWESAQVQAVSIALAFQADILVCSWTWVPYSGGAGWISGISYTYQAQAEVGIFAWTTPAIAIACSQSFFEGAQTCSWPMPTSGSVGILTYSVGIGSPTQDQEVAEFNALVPSIVLAISCNSPPNGTVGVSYTHTILAGGGTPPYSFSITSGSLPTGLSLNASTGVISGTPTVASAYSFQVTVTDFTSATAAVTCSITIVAAGALAISCNFPPAGFVGIPYSHTILAVGGTPPYTFTITSGALPTGLSINASTGVISGTPTVAATYSFQVTVTDFVSATAAVTCSILIYAAGVAGNIYRAFYQ